MKRTAAIFAFIVLALVVFSGAVFAGGLAEEIEISVEMEELPAVVETAPETEEETGVRTVGEIIAFPSSLDESVLAENYINSSLPQKRTILRVSRPSGLIKFAANTANRNLYLALRKQVTSVANGDNISTIFSIKTEDIFPSISFTAEDLGVEALFNDAGQVKWQANKSFWEKVDEMAAEIAFSDVALCVINDSPYELFWFGLRAQVLENSFEMMQYSDHSALILRGTYNVVFYVNPDYAVIPDGWDEESPLSEVDTNKYGSVTRARETINDIRASVSGMDDEQMMKYFADWICSHVSYNWDAVNEYKEKKRKYGDPWQLVWVFDTESEQKVVCEGYAKAFAYLCELCTDSAEAIIVWGDIPSGAHMWNIVSFDGHNYLVDLTNHGTSRDLFLVGGDGSVEDGYSAGGLDYTYNRKQTTRTDDELTLAPYSYAEWKEATTTAPNVWISSDRTFPGFMVAVEVESSNGMLPVDAIVVMRGEEQESFDGDTALLEFAEGAMLRVSAVIDGITTPEADGVMITVAEPPETQLLLPPGSVIESEAFSGVPVELIRINENKLAADAFDENIILGVDEIADWNRYRYVISTQ